MPGRLAGRYHSTRRSCYFFAASCGLHGHVAVMDRSMSKRHDKHLTNAPPASRIPILAARLSRSGLSNQEQPGAASNCGQKPAPVRSVETVRGRPPDQPVPDAGLSEDRDQVESAAAKPTLLNTSGARSSAAILAILAQQEGWAEVSNGGKGDVFWVVSRRSRAIRIFLHTTDAKTP